MWPLIFGVAILNVFTGIQYFRKSSDREERVFFNSLVRAKHWQATRLYSEEYTLAAYISDIVDETHKILMDDASAYKIMAHLRTLKFVVMPMDHEFVTVVENPKLGARYICVAKSVNRLRGFTVLNEYNIGQMELRQQFKPILMFETKNWAIYKIT